MTFQTPADAHLDAGVILNYASPRGIDHSPLVLGRGARIRSGSVLYESSVIGDFIETGHNVVLREQNRIGDHFSIWNNSCVDYGCVIGSRVRIHNNVYIAQFTEIEDDVFIAPGVMTANDPHPIGTTCMKGPRLLRGCRIGVNSTLLDHVTIGKGSLVGAGSVVTNDIPDFVLAYGSPARVIRPLDQLTCKWCDEVPYVDGHDVRTRSRNHA